MQVTGQGLALAGLTGIGSGHAFPDSFIRNGILDLTIYNDGPDPTNQFIIRTQDTDDADPINYVGNADFGNPAVTNILFVTTVLPQAIPSHGIAKVRVLIGSVHKFDIQVASVGQSNIRYKGNVQ